MRGGPAEAGGVTAPRHFLDLWRMDAASLRSILEDAKFRKARRAGLGQAEVDGDAPAAGRTLAMIFQKNSTRTRFSFDAAIRQLGGASIIATATDMQLGRGETIEDTARVLSRMVDAVMIRAISHADIEAFARAATVPVINGLTDKSHPCQILADVMTFEEHRGPIAGKTIAWVGDGNNVCASFIHAAAKFGFKLIIAGPREYPPDPADLAKAAQAGGQVIVTDDMFAAAKGADCVVADGWVSMGDADYQERVAAFEPYRVDAALMALAAPDAVFLHCLPAHRGEEVTDEVIDGPQSLVWDEAENRIHAQKSILAWCFGAVG
jgi:ornithine carbamoyltransferase